MPAKNEPGLLKIYWDHTVSILPTWGFPLLFVWAFLFGGIATLIFGSVSSIEAFYSRSWPIVEGVIKVSQVDTYLSQSDTGATTMYHPQVSFNYFVNGKQYHSDLISLGDYSTSDQKQTENMLSLYPIGKLVRVYYDPGRPDRAVLEPGPTGGLLIPLFVGTAVTALGVIMTILLFRQMFAGIHPE